MNNTNCANSYDSSRFKILNNCTNSIDLVRMEAISIFFNKPELCKQKEFDYKDFFTCLILFLVYLF